MRPMPKTPKKTGYTVRTSGATNCRTILPTGEAAEPALPHVSSGWKNMQRRKQPSNSCLKRAFGLDRCSWSGWGGFKQYVWSSIVSYNLLVMARIRLAEA